MFYEGQRVKVKKCRVGRTHCPCLGAVGVLKGLLLAKGGVWSFESEQFTGEVEECHIEPHFLPGDKARLKHPYKLTLPPGFSGTFFFYADALNPANEYTIEKMEGDCIRLSRRQIASGASSLRSIYVTLNSIEALPPKITPADISKAIAEVRAGELATEAKPVEFKIGDWVKTETNAVGVLERRCCDSWLVRSADGTGCWWRDDQLTLLPKEEADGVPAVFLPGTVETINTYVGDWYYIGIDTPRGIVNFPLKREEAKGIRIGQEYAISLRKG